MSEIRLIDANAFADFIEDTIKMQNYDEFYPKNMSVGEILRSVIADL